VLRLLLEGSVRALLVAAGTGGALWMLRVRSAGVRHAAWTGVVAVMLALPAWMAWGPHASLRLLPAASAPAVVAAPVLLEMQLPAAAVSTARLAAPPAHWNWPAIVYLAGVLVFLVRLAIGTWRARTLVRTATLRDGRLTSPFCAAPVTVGFFRPVVILPDCRRDWPAVQLAAVLTHEGEHVRRRDPLVQWVALFNRAIFWFHPLAWWVERHLSALAEEACDAAVLDGGCDPHDYSGYLLDLARSVGRSGARVRFVGMAMPGSSLPRRIRQVLARRPAPRVSSVRAASLAIACASMSALFAAANVDRQPFIPDPPMPAAPPSAPISKSELLPAPVQVPPQPAEKRLIALYFDLDGATADLQARAITAAVGIVQRQMATGQFAILTWSNGALKTIEDFTADHGRLIASLQKLQNDPGADPGKAYGLLAAVKMLSALREKKSLVYFAVPALRVSASPDEVQAVVAAAVTANVAFFPVDVTGLTAGAQGGAVIHAGDALAISLEYGHHRNAGRGVVYLMRAGARAEYDRISAPFSGHTFTVQPDGTVSIPELGDVQAGGLTTEQLESTIGPALAARLSTPKFPISGATVEKR